MFQSTPPRGGRLCDALQGIAFDDVSIHAPARGATEGGKETAGISVVSIHAPARGATLARPAQIEPQVVSIHAPARGATRVLAAVLQHAEVSIHAPARGATPGGGEPGRLDGVSIHAPARGATSRSTAARSETASRRFNPRPRAGGDQQPLAGRGARRRACFNPRLFGVNYFCRLASTILAVPVVVN